MSLARKGVKRLYTGAAGFSRQKRAPRSSQRSRGAPSIRDYYYGTRDG